MGDVGVMLVQICSPSISMAMLMADVASKIHTVDHSFVHVMGVIALCTRPEDEVVLQKPRPFKAFDPWLR